MWKHRKRCISYLYYRLDLTVVSCTRSCHGSNDSAEPKHYCREPQEHFCAPAVGLLHHIERVAHEKLQEQVRKCLLLQSTRLTSNMAALGGIGWASNCVPVLAQTKGWPSSILPQATWNEASAPLVSCISLLCSTAINLIMHGSVCSSVQRNIN